ncbi:hypothetical protein MMC25_001430 [Agyrium rufum]|nr:hypothetical protein [Agyrium rufum]
MSRDLLQILRAQYQTLERSGSLAFQLPNLYHTQTLLASPHPPYLSRTKPPICFPNRRFLSSGTRASRRHEDATDRIPFETKIEEQQNSALRRQPTYPDEEDEECAFEDESPSLNYAPRARTSTITAHERSVFEKIFKSLRDSSKTNPKKLTNRIFQARDLSDELILEGEKVMDFYDNDGGEMQTLEGLLANVIGERDQLLSGDDQAQALNDIEDGGREEQQVLPRRPILDKEKFPPALRMAIDAALTEEEAPRREQARQATARQNAAASEEEDQLTIARKEDYENVKALIDAAPNDVELWRVLATHVFPRVRALTEELEQTYNAATKATPGDKGAKFSRRKTTKPSKTKAGKKMKMATASKAPEGALPSPSGLILLQTTYPQILTHSLRRLRYFSPHSPFALQILPAVISLGPISYVLGANTSLYNELLLIKWRVYFDAADIGRLVQEMVAKGVGVDDNTMRILREMQAWWAAVAGNEVERLKAPTIVAPLHASGSSRPVRIEGTLAARPILKAESNPDSKPSSSKLVEAVDMTGINTVRLGGGRLAVGQVMAELRGVRVAWKKWAQGFSMAFRERRAAKRELRRELEIRQQEVRELKGEKDETADMGMGREDGQAGWGPGRNKFKPDNDSDRERQEARERGVVML